MVTARLARFSLVGVIGFLVDALVLYVSLYRLGVGLYGGRLLSYMAAATTTWALNRRYTFPDGRTPSLAREYGRFLAANSLGGAVNYVTYAAMVNIMPMTKISPFLAVAMGSVAGLAVNFSLSRRFVFTGHRR